MVRRFAFAVALCVWVLFAVADPARASLILTMVQDPTGVSVAGSGSFDVSALTLLPGAANADAGLTPSIPTVLVGALGGVSVDVYSGGVSGPFSFGAGSLSFPTLGGGPRLGISRGAEFFLLVPDAYVSGSALGNAINTYAGATYASLGVTPGTYVWSWGSGAHADSLTLQINPAPAAVPEPASMTLLGMGLAGLSARRWRQRRKS
jgi:hypothetical protein